MGASRKAMRGCATLGWAGWLRGRGGEGRSVARGLMGACPLTYTTADGRRVRGGGFTRCMTLMKKYLSCVESRLKERS